MLVLNATYEPINVCTVRRAAVLLLKEKAEIVERAAWELHSEHTLMPRPVVIRLVALRERAARHAERRRITRRAVFARDGWTCQYCGSRSSLTVDHVIPRSKGGDSSWENIVASCAPCNRRKGDRLPAQADMHPPQGAARPAPARLHPRRRPTNPPRLASMAPRRRTGLSPLSRRSAARRPSEPASRASASLIGAGTRRSRREWAAIPHRSMRPGPDHSVSPENDRGRQVRQPDALRTSMTG